VQLQGRTLSLPNTVLHAEPYFIGSFSYIVGMREVYATRQDKMLIRICIKDIPYECNSENM
jgi:hypothetical protein